MNYAELQVACINIMQFAVVARGGEILSLQVRDLCFSGDYADSPIIGMLPITKNRKTSYTYFRFTKGIDISICGLNTLKGWLNVLLAHGLYEENIFMHVKSNVLQGGTQLDGKTYGKLLKIMGEQCGVVGLAEHSARRGGIGYLYFVLRRDLLFLYRAYSWETLSEMLKYIGIEDVHNSFALLGFTSFGTNELHSPATFQG